MTHIAPEAPHVRRRDSDLTDRILDATSQTLVAEGFAALRIEHIAAAVGCGKTAIYRRWSTKDELAAAVLVRGAEIGELPDTGTLSGDLEIHQSQNNVVRSANKGPRALRLWATLAEPAVRDLVDAQLLRLRRERGRTIIARAVSRDEVPPETDADAVLDLLAGFAFYRSVIRELPLPAPTLGELARVISACPPLRTHG